MESFTPRPPNPFQAWIGKLVPWAPFQMVFAGLLTGPLGASCLAALNWELLGQPQQRRKALRWLAFPGLVIFGLLVVTFATAEE